MKTSFTLLTLSLVFLYSCTETVVGPAGPRGDQGPVGPQGAAGESGYVFEYENINFSAGNNYEVLLEYPSDFEGLQSDVALVYLLWPLEDNLDYDVWRLLPQQTLFNDGGILQYNYDFTTSDVRLFLDANFPLNELGAIHTDQWIARVVVVPGEFWGGGRMDFSDYEDVKELLGLPDLSIGRNNEMVRSE